MALNCSLGLARLNFAFAWLTTGAFIATATAAEGQTLSWYELDRVAGDVGQSLRRARDQVCGPPRIQDLPISVPPGSQLVLMACQGGTHICSDERALTSSGAALGCPEYPGSQDIATLHLVTTTDLQAVIRLYAKELGADFVQLQRPEPGPGASAGPDPVHTFLQRPDTLLDHEWSPRRMLVQVSPAKGPLRYGGHRTQVRVSLYREPLHGRQSRWSCVAARGLRFGYDGRKRTTRSVSDPVPPWCLIERPGRAPEAVQR